MNILNPRPRPCFSAALATPAPTPTIYTCAKTDSSIGVWALTCRRSRRWWLLSQLQRPPSFLTAGIGSHVRFKAFISKRSL